MLIKQKKEHTSVSEVIVGIECDICMEKLKINDEGTVQDYTELRIGGRSAEVNGYYPEHNAAYEKILCICPKCCENNKTKIHGKIDEWIEDNLRYMDVFEA